MSARVRSRTMLLATLLASLLTLAQLATPHAAQSQPQAHHPGQWTTAQNWPGTASGVQAVHMALVRGDTLFGIPHSLVLAWGSGHPSNGGTSWDGGLWGWSPTTDAGSGVLANLSNLSLASPPFNPFCGSHVALPDAGGDLLVAGGHERNIVGETRTMRFQRESRTWLEVAPMADRRWYGNLTGLPDGKVLAAGSSTNTSSWPAAAPARAR